MSSYSHKYLLKFTNYHYSFILINMKKEVLLYPRERRYLAEVGKQIRLALCFLLYVWKETYFFLPERTRWVMKCRTKDCL